MDQYPFKLEMYLILDDYCELIEYLKKNKKFEYYGRHAEKLLNKQIEDF